jgi:hypothetical protein
MKPTIAVLLMLGLVGCSYFKQTPIFSCGDRTLCDLETLKYEENSAGRQEMISLLRQCSSLYVQAPNESVEDFVKLAPPPKGNACWVFKEQPQVAKNPILLPEGITAIGGTFMHEEKP